MGSGRLAARSRELGRKKCAVLGGSWQWAMGGLVEKIAQFLWGTHSRLLARKIALMLGSKPANHLWIFFELSGMLGSRGLAHEICVVFWVRSQRDPIVI